MIQTLKTFNINFYINILTIIFAFGLGLVKFLIPISGALMIILWLIEGNFKIKYQKIIQYKSLIIFLFFIFYLFLTLFISANINYPLHPRGFWVSWTENPFEYYFRHYIFYTIVLIVLVTSLKKDFIQYIISAFIFGMLINEITSYLVFFGLISPIHKDIGGIVPFFINHSYYSFFLVITLFLMIIKIIKTYTSKYMKIIFAMFIITASINLMINTGRVGQISFFIMSIIAIFYFFKIKIKTIFFTIIMIPTLIIVFYNSSKPFQQRMDKTKYSIEKIYKGNLNTSIGQRVAMDIVGITIFKQYPLFGVGIDEAMNAKAKYIDKTNQYPFVKQFIQFHNQYIQYLVEGGVVGIIIFIMFFIFLFLEKTYGFGKDIKYLIIPIFLLTFFTETPLLRDRSFALFMLFYAIILIYSKNQKNSTT